MWCMCTGKAVRMSVISQFINPPDLLTLFGRVIHVPNLDDMFRKKSPWFYKRTSSAVWDKSFFKCTP